MNPVPTVELFDELVASGLAAGKARDLLNVQLEIAGYPPDWPELLVADAFDIRLRLWDELGGR